jgi:hypothetical protein
MEKRLLTVEEAVTAEAGVRAESGTTAEGGSEERGRGVLMAGASDNLCAQLTHAYLLFPAAEGSWKKRRSFSSLKVSLRPLWARVRGERGVRSQP